jgi:hypothetical protein
MVPKSQRVTLDCMEVSYVVSRVYATCSECVSATNDECVFATNVSNAMNAYALHALYHMKHQASSRSATMADASTEAIAVVLRERFSALAAQRVLGSGVLEPIDRARLLAYVSAGVRAAAATGSTRRGGVANFTTARRGARPPRPSRTSSWSEHKSQTTRSSSDG